MSDTTLDQAETQETPVAEVRDHSKVAQELKNSVGKLARNEAKAVESDEAAATFNQDILDMATGVTPQTPQRSIQTISTEQAKHVKRAAKIRENNTDLAGLIRELDAEYSEMIAELLTAYPVAETETDENEGTDSDADLSEDELDEDAA
jgi:hypothetical protein